MQSWEYAAADFTKLEKAVPELDRLGAEGWEAVSLASTWGQTDGASCMGRPRVIIHNLISLDGRLDGFPANAWLYYELAPQLPHQAVLTGSDTVLAAAAGQDIDMSGEDTEPSPGAAAAVPAAAGDTRPLLVIVDGRGRLTRYASLRVDLSASPDSWPGSADPVALELTAMEHLRQGHVWLRYDVRDGPGGWNESRAGIWWRWSGAARTRGPWQAASRGWSLAMQGM